MNTPAELYREWEAQYDASVAQARRLGGDPPDDYWAPLLNIFSPGDTEPLGFSF